MEDVPAECTVPELCFGSVSHLGTCRHSRRKVSDEQDTGTRLDELGADSEESCGGSTGRGHDSAEEISRRGELYVHKNGQLWWCGHGWMWMGKVGLWLKASSGAEKVFERSSVEALGAGDCWDCEQHKNVPYKSSWDQSPLHPPKCSTQGLAHGGLLRCRPERPITQIFHSPEQISRLCQKPLRELWSFPLLWAGAMRWALFSTKTADPLYQR